MLARMGGNGRIKNNVVSTAMCKEKIAMAIPFQTHPLVVHLRPNSMHRPCTNHLLNTIRQTVVTGLALCPCHHNRIFSLAAECDGRKVAPVPWRTSVHNPHRAVHTPAMTGVFRPSVQHHQHHTSAARTHLNRNKKIVGVLTACRPPGRLGQFCVLLT